MSIGDFSRSTRLTAKTLRFYHQAGLLEPARVDPHTGYRGYSADQIADAEVVRHFRSLEMPISLIRQVLSAELPARNGLIAEHLARMESQLEATRSAVESLRELLAPAQAVSRIDHRHFAAFPALIIRANIELADLGTWYTNSTRSLQDALIRTRARQIGARGGMWSTELFVDEMGEAALFVPTEELVDPAILPEGIVSEIVPAADFAVIVHRGPDRTVARAYGELGAYVARAGLGVDGPVREIYLQDVADTGADAVTEIGWPIDPALR